MLVGIAAIITALLGCAAFVLTEIRGHRRNTREHRENGQKITDGFERLSVRMDQLDRARALDHTYLHTGLGDIRQAVVSVQADNQVLFGMVADVDSKVTQLADAVDKGKKATDGRHPSRTTVGVK